MTRSHSLPLRFLFPLLAAALPMVNLDVARAQAPSQAPTAVSADTILAKLDAGVSSFKDATFKFKMRILEPSGVREIAFTTWLKGPQRKVIFSAPADIKGMGILVESPEVMYARLPQFGNRIRRVANHQTGGNFMGSDLTNDDMAVLEYSPLYTAKKVASEGDADVLELNLRPGKQSVWPRLKLWVNRTPFYPTKIEYYDDKGQKLRSCERLEYKRDNAANTPEHYSPGKMVYTDHRRNDHKTELILLESQLDTGLSDDLFKQRSLSNGE